jgi:CheY-like chemotaxis protein
MASGIAHDFNNMLAAILGYTEMSMDDVPEQSLVYTNLKLIQQAGEKAKELVKQILTFSNQTQGTIKPVQISIVLQDVIKLLHYTLPGTISIKQDIDENCGLINADPIQIQQCIMNMCTNAYQAIGEKTGTIEISLTKVDKKQFLKHRLSKLQKDDFILLSIKDNGTGMDKDTISRIFDPFFTTKEVGKGTGLGLSVVHGVIKSINGFINVESKLNEGTTFNIFLPVMSQKEQDDIFYSNLFPSKSTQNILIIDNDENILLIIKQMLEKFNYNVTTKANSMEAVKLFKISPYYYDLIIIDQQLSDYTVDSFKKEVLRIRPDMPIIQISGDRNNLSADLSERTELNEYCYKPLDMEQLINQIQTILKKKEEIFS